MTEDEYETFYQILDHLVEEAGISPTVIDRDEKPAAYVVREDYFQELVEKARAYDDIFSDPITEREEEKLLETLERPARLH